MLAYHSIFFLLVSYADPSNLLDGVGAFLWFVPVESVAWPAKEADDILSLVSYNAEQCIAVVRAAEAKRSPAIILFFPVTLRYGGSGLLKMAVELAERASVPISVHLDHGKTQLLICSNSTSGLIPLRRRERDERSRYRLRTELSRRPVRFCHDRRIAWRTG
jgi:hypothetical protein